MEVDALYTFSNLPLSAHKCPQALEGSSKTIASGYLSYLFFQNFISVSTHFKLDKIGIKATSGYHATYLGRFNGNHAPETIPWTHALQEAFTWAS